MRSFIINSAPRWRIGGEFDDVPAPFSLGVGRNFVEGLLGMISDASEPFKTSDAILQVRWWNQVDEFRELKLAGVSASCETSAMHSI
jgi:hypothetical protein